jgi:hypothetical protein
MTLAEFEELLDRCGADPAAWPPGAEPGARRLMAADPAAGAAQEAMAAAEAALRAPFDLGEFPDFAAQAMAAPQEPPWRRRLSLALAASLVLSVGLAAGALKPRGEDPAAVLSSALFTGGDGGDVE